MFANYHTHTTRCRHAMGDDRAYIEAAIESGVKILGFSDHATFPDHGCVGMQPQELQEYMSTFRSLREEFKSRVQIHIGLELEYSPKEFVRQLDFLRQHGVEYLILGQHFLFGMDYPAGIHTPCFDARYLDYHCGLQREAMDTGVISYIAHPDIFNFAGSKEEYDRHIRPMCRHARDLNIPLEINLLGLRTNRHYPREHFWQIAGEEGCPVVLGCDAHEPEAFHDKSAPLAAMTLVDKYQLNLQQTVTLRQV